MRGFLGVLTLAVFGISASGQNPLSSSTFTAGAGGSFTISAQATNGSVYANAPTFVGSYELRIRKYLAAEIGVENALPIYTLYGGDGNFATYRVHTIFLPFGLRGIIPIHNDRTELYAGFGGAYVWHSEYEGDYATATSSGHALNELLWQLNSGGRFAIDHRHRYWVGSTVRYYRDGLGTSAQQYISWTGDFSFRFGR